MRITYNVYGTQPYKPPEFENDNGIVYLRRDIRRVMVTDGQSGATMEQWQYGEIQLTSDEYLLLSRALTDEQILAAYIGSGTAN